MKLVKCRWRTDSVCPHPAICRYGYECVARPAEPSPAYNARGEAVSVDRANRDRAHDTWLRIAHERGEEP